MDPLTISLIAAGVGAAGSIGGGYLAGRNTTPKETKQQKMSRKVADELVTSLKGNGPYSHLFQNDEAAFQKSIVDPAKSRFRNQIAPQIQQMFGANGQQRGTGLDDQLLRAGVDLDQLINEKYLQFQQGGQDRMTNALNSVIGMGPGAPRQISSGDTLGQSAGGYFASPAFSDALKGITNAYSQPQQAQQQNINQPPVRRGFSPDWQDYSKWQLGDSRWGQ